MVYTCTNSQHDRVSRVLHVLRVSRVSCVLRVLRVSRVLRVLHVLFVSRVLGVLPKTGDEQKLVVWRWSDACIIA
jgi:hypothetical protein